jgi:hypothetical protein
VLDVIIAGAGKWAVECWVPTTEPNASTARSPARTTSSPSPEAARKTHLPIPPDEPLAGHRHIAISFAAWLDGGPTIETCLDDNLISAAALFAARQASATGQTVPV